jgi:S-sulfosulfanyl-L-cysteine sulfohydrolase
MNLSIAYINDVHGYLESHPELFYRGGEEYIEKAGGYSLIASVVNDIRKNNPDTLLFDGGDTFHGTLPLVQSKGEALVPILNKMNFSAMVGHWDFAYGPVQLKNLAQQLNYPVLGINVYNKEDGSLFLPPYIIKQLDDLKVGVIGICCNIIDKVMPGKFSKGIRFTDGSAELPGYIQKVKDEGADIIILLSHNGFPQDVSLLSNIKGVDICLSAHTHNRLYEAIRVNDCTVIQCGCHGSFVGHLQLQIEKKKITSVTYELITVDDSIKPEPEIEQLVKEIMEPYQSLKEEKFGQTSEILHRYSTLSSTMDYLLLSAIKSAGEADIAFSNGWRYGSPVPAGPITKWNLYNIIPMNPVVSTVEMTGQEIIKMLEENLERTFSDNPMKQMGGYVKRCLGVNVKMRIENPKGSRIQEIYFGDEHLQKDTVYKAAFVTMQGVAKKYGNNRKDLEIKAVEAMEAFLNKNPDFKHISYNTFCLV